MVHFLIGLHQHAQNLQLITLGLGQLPFALDYKAVHHLLCPKVVVLLNSTK